MTVLNTLKLTSMSRGKYCRRKNNAKSNYLVIHQGIDDRCRPRRQVSRHIDHYVAHPSIDKDNTVSGKAYIQQPVRTPLLEDCINDNVLEKLRRSIEPQFQIEPEVSISLHEEELQYEEPIGLETSTDMNGDTLKGVPALLKVFGERIGDMAIFGVINRFFKR